MITSEIYINKLNSDKQLEFNEQDLHNTIDNVFKNVGDINPSINKTWWYYIKFFFCCGYVVK